MTTLASKTEKFLSAAAFGGIHNLTPHAITVAGITYPPSGIVARVSEEYETEGTFCAVQKGKVTFEKGGEPFSLAAHEFDGTVNIVSAMVFEVTKDWHTGVWVAPATGHPNVVRNEKGYIVSVPCFRLI